MKLLYVIYDISQLGGVERVLLQKALYLTKEYGYEVTILSENQSNEIFFDNYDLSSIKFKNMKLTWSKNSLLRQIQKLPAFARLKKFVKQEDYDIVITVGSYFDSWLPSLSCPVVREIHCAKMSFQYSKFSNWMQLRALRKYQKVVILTQADLPNWNLPNMCVIPNPLPLPIGEKNNYSAKKVISLGRLTQQKGYDLLIPIWKSLVPYFPDWTLEIYGSGREQAALQQQINAAGISDSFLLKGVVKNPSSVYESGSIYVLPSRYEGFPLVILEAMASGLPVVAYDCLTGPREMITDQVDGYLVPFGQQQEFANCLAKLMIDQDLRYKLGQQAQINSQRFDPEKVMPMWKSLFTELKTKNKLGGSNGK